METGQIKWEAILGDRVESSACMSSCGKFVIVGELFIEVGIVDEEYSQSCEIKSDSQRMSQDH